MRWDEIIHSIQRKKERPRGKRWMCVARIRRTLHSALSRCFTNFPECSTHSQRWHEIHCLLLTPFFTLLNNPRHFTLAFFLLQLFSVLFLTLLNSHPLYSFQHHQSSSFSVVYGFYDVVYSSQRSSHFLPQKPYSLLSPPQPSLPPLLLQTHFPQIASLSYKWISQNSNKFQTFLCSLWSFKWKGNTF